MKSKKIDIIVEEEEPETERFEKVTEWNRADMPEIYIDTAMMIYLLAGIAVGWLFGIGEISFSLTMLIAIGGVILTLLVLYHFGYFGKRYLQKVKVRGKA